MALIPADVIERLKREVSVQRLFEEIGVTFKKKGKDLVALCPWHDDKTESLVVTPASNLYHCFGCQEGGTCIDFVKKAHGVSFPHAVEMLLNDAYSPRHLPAAPKPASKSSTAKPSLVKHSTVKRLPPPVDYDAGDQDLLRQVLAFYHEALKQSPEALEYLKQRGLESAELVDCFQLGYANRRLGYRLPDKNRKTGADIRGRLTELGIYRESGHEHFNGSLVIPVFDEEGHVAEIYGRKVTPAHKLRDGTPLHLYLRGPHRGVWNVEALAISKEVILCEALLDALSFWCAGYRNVTASYGVEGFTADHLAAFKRYGTERVLIAYDRDEAGEKAATRLAEKLIAEGLQCYRIHFPKGMDANEYALKVKPATKSLGIVIRKALWLGSGKPPSVELGASPQLEAEDLVHDPAAAAISLDQEVVEASKREAASPSAEALAAGDASPVVAAAPPATTAAEGSAEPSAASFSLEAPRLSEAKTAPATAPERPAQVAAAIDMEPLASPEPRPAAPTLPVELHGTQIHIRLGDRIYRARGLPKQPSNERLPVTLTVARGDAEDAASFTDRLDLVLAKHREVYAEKAAGEVGVKPEVLARDLAKLFNRLEQFLEDEQQKRLAAEDKTVRLSDEEKAQAMALLQDPNLLERILADFERAGVVGEETNKLVGYLAAVSRKLKKPLGVIIQSSSAAGKSALMEAILAFLPEEERKQYSAVTGQALFYMEETNLKHKVLAIVEGEGAERACYALKLLLSEGKLTIATTGKNAETGELAARTYHVEGPVMILFTTTAVELDEELLNRCLVLTVNEDRAQTRAIHRRQRESETLEGVLAQQECQDLLRLHQNAQRLLRPLTVINPFGDQLTFCDERTRMRRDHMKYLVLIRTIALLHQHQRELKESERKGRPFTYIEVTLEDIAVANLLADEVLGRSLDELAPQTRRLLLLLDELVTKECTRLTMERQDFRFSRREVRETTGWGQTQIQLHLNRLVELEYLVVHHGGRGQTFEYELVYDSRGKEGEPFLPGLLDVAKLAASHGYDANLSGLESRLSALRTKLSGSNRPPIGVTSGGYRLESSDETPLSQEEKPGSRGKSAENVVPAVAPHADPRRSRIRMVPHRKVR